MFVGTPEVLDAIEYAKPDDRFLDLRDPEEVSHITARNVSWNTDDAHYVVRVPVERVLFMEGNIWNFSHARALAEAARVSDVTFELPAARLYRIDEDDVEGSREDQRDARLEYNLGMLQPWDDSDAGHFYVQLLDGNHRALAAMYIGEPYIYVTVGPNYREDVLPEEWVISR